MRSSLFPAITMLSALLIASTAPAEIYKIVDKQGRVTYTDSPPANTKAKQVDIPTLNSLPTPQAMPSTDSAQLQQQASEFKIEIISPKNGDTFLVDERSITITVNIEQGLAEGISVAYKLDGTTLQKTTDMSYTLEDAPRGEHTLTAAVVDANDQTLAESDPVKVIIMRPINKQKAVPLPTKK